MDLRKYFDRKRALPSSSDESDGDGIEGSMEDNSSSSSSVSAASNSGGQSMSKSESI